MWSDAPLSALSADLVSIACARRPGRLARVLRVSGWLAPRVSADPAAFARLPAVDALLVGLVAAQSPDAGLRAWGRARLGSAVPAAPTGDELVDALSALLGHQRALVAERLAPAPVVGTPADAAWRRLVDAVGRAAPGRWERLRGSLGEVDAWLLAAAEAEAGTGWARAYAEGRAAVA